MLDPLFRADAIERMAELRSGWAIFRYVGGLDSALREHVPT
jgi:hypothetical protein